MYSLTFKQARTNTHSIKSMHTHSQTHTYSHLLTYQYYKVTGCLSVYLSKAYLLQNGWINLANFFFLALYWSGDGFYQKISRSGFSRNPKIPVFKAFFLPILLTFSRKIPFHPNIILKKNFPDLASGLSPCDTSIFIISTWGVHFWDLVCNWADFFEIFGRFLKILYEIENLGEV